MKFLQIDASWNAAGDNANFRRLEDAESARHLNQFLGVIASLSPPLLHGDIINDTTKLSDIYKLLRTYYQFVPSESTFMKFASIKREIVGGNLERPLHLYLRMRQFIRDNLLLSSGHIYHDGKLPSADEKLSPTTERLIVLRWLEILHPTLPAHITNVFSHDLQTKSLKDIQPRISEQIHDLLLQVESKESCLETQLSRVSFKNFGNYDRRYQGNQHSSNRNDFGDYNKRYENRNNRGRKNYPPKKSGVFVKKNVMPVVRLGNHL